MKPPWGQGRYKQYELAEDIDLYRPGGFHPVHLNDVLHGRYEVFGRLGSGGFATVWLAKDRLIGRWCSLKILTAEASNPCEELVIVKRLQNAKGGPGREFLVRVWDEFVVRGPNGTHQCFVSELLGASVALAKEAGLPKSAAKAIAAQVASGLAYLHEHQIIHGGERVQEQQE